MNIDTTCNGLSGKVSWNSTRRRRLSARPARQPEGPAKPNKKHYDPVSAAQSRRELQQRSRSLRRSQLHKSQLLIIKRPLFEGPFYYQFLLSSSYRSSSSFLSNSSPLRLFPTIFPCGSSRKFVGMLLTPYAFATALFQNCRSDTCCQVNPSLWIAPSHLSLSPGLSRETLRILNPFPFIFIISNYHIGFSIRQGPHQLPRNPPVHNHPGKKKTYRLVQGIVLRKIRRYLTNTRCLGRH